MTTEGPDPASTVHSPLRDVQPILPRSPSEHYYRQASFSTVGSTSDQRHRTTGTVSESLNLRILATDTHKLRRNSSLRAHYSTGQGSRELPSTKQYVSDCGGISLARSAFVEHDVHLARQVAAVWNNEVNQGRTRIPHIPIACDILDLCRPEQSPLGTAADENPNQADLVTPLSRFAQSLPTGCITAIVAGSPCQQLTCAGRYRGQEGLCGPDSVFFSVPTVAWILQALRPDTNVHVVLENAASMQTMHKRAIMQAPGGPNVSEHLRTLDSGAWSAFPRRRHYFMTLPENEDIVHPTRHAVPLEPGWGPIPSAVLYPMVCSRDDTNPRASTIQYHAQSLVYRYAENGNGFDWHARPERHVRARIIRTMPDELKALYVRNALVRANDQRRKPNGPGH